MGDSEQSGWDMTRFKDNGMEPVLAPDLHDEPYRPWNDLSRAIAAVGEMIHQNKLAKGWTVTTPEKWADENQVPADLALVHSEVSEALEAFRKGEKEAFAEELADVMIRLIGLAHGLEIDLAGELYAKVTKNAKRPYRHGGKRL